MPPHDSENLRRQRCKVFHSNGILFLQNAPYASPPSSPAFRPRPQTPLALETRWLLIWTGRPTTWKSGREVNMKLVEKEPALTFDPAVKLCQHIYIFARKQADEKQKNGSGHIGTERRVLFHRGPIPRYRRYHRPIDSPAHLGFNWSIAADSVGQATL